MNLSIRKIYRQIRDQVFGYGKINPNNSGILNFIDVGSASANMPEPWHTNSKYIRKLLCFDPQENQSNNSDIISIDAGLWKEQAELPFYIYKGLSQSGSSLFEQNFEYVTQNFEQIKNRGPKRLAETWFKRCELEKTLHIKVTSLDQVIASLKLSDSFDFLKVDAQGAEYEILQGAQQFLSHHCIGLQLELFNIPLYKGIQLEPAVTNFLKKYGFKLVQKLPFHGTFNSQNDCIYLKEDVPSSKIEKLNLLKKIYQI